MPSNQPLLQKFRDSLAAQDEGAWQKAFFGENSALARLLRRSAECSFDFSSALEAVDGAIRATDKVNPEADSQLASEANRRLSYLMSLLKAAQNAKKPTERQSSLTEAIQHLDSFWPSPVERDPLAIELNTSQAWHGLCEDLNQTSGDPRSLLAAIWTLEDWLLEEPVPSPRRAETSILSPIDSGLLRFEVELRPAVSCGQIVPNLPEMGLTCIRHTAADEDLLISIERAWRQSQLASKWHARWRIVQPPELATTSPLYLKRLHGRSAEAAALCALLAASGDPWGDLPPVAGETTPLDLTIALSARLDQASPGSFDPRQIPLAVVGGTQGKIETAVEKRLTHVLLGPEQQWHDTASPALRQWVEEVRVKQALAIQNNRNYDGILVEHVATVGEALDWMLLVNRLLRDYQSRLRSDWLSRWKGETGRARCDTRPVFSPQASDSSADSPGAPVP